jgi:hypothetical protein
MFGQTFYHELLRKYIIMFGNLFNDIQVNRYDASNNLITNLRVPVNYGPREKALSRLDQNPDLIPEYAMILPRMSFEMTSMNYAPTRKLNTIDRKVYQTGSDTSRLKFQYNPVPYDINMALSIMVKNADDGAQILEQILPYFTPEWTTTMNVIPEMNIKQDVPVVLQGVSTEDTYEGSFEQRRALIHTIDFIIKGYFYGPVRTSEVIKSTQIDIGAVTSNTQYVVDTQSGRTLVETQGISDADVARTGRNSRITAVPTLLANGSTTNSVSESIDAGLIDAADNFGFGISKNFYIDGKKYNPVTDSDE